MVPAAARWRGRGRRPNQRQHRCRVVWDRLCPSSLPALKVKRQSKVDSAGRRGTGERPALAASAVLVWSHKLNERALRGQHDGAARPTRAPTARRRWVSSSPRPIARAARCARTFATKMHEPVRTVDNISLIPPIDVHAHTNTELPRTVPDTLGSALHGDTGRCGAAAGRAGRICGVRPWHLNMCSSGGLEPLYCVAARAYDNTTKHTQV